MRQNVGIQTVGSAGARNADLPFRPWTQKTVGAGAR